ncbi:MAG: chemotaxis protein CheW, partial [Actinomycetota bacterium]|nr:chemotaxis protein CheW [Actinomycetota bacterium]
MAAAALTRQSTGTQQFTTFVLDGHLFGVEVETVQEVIRYQAMTRVPLAPGAVGGLINLRGQVITALDLRRRLGMADRPDGVLPMNVVVRTEEGAVSLLVDQIGDVVETDAASFETPPDTVAPAARELIRGAYKLDGTLLLALDVP